MDATSRDYIYAFFPYLKTTDPALIGKLAFRSTENVQGLTTEQAAHVQNIAAMLFLRDNLRIRSASYAVVRITDFSTLSDALAHLADIQSVVAYQYAAPRHDGILFFSSEYATMITLMPDEVPSSLVRPSFHVDCISDDCRAVSINKYHVEGYSGLYGFRHHFYAAPGSRLYPPMPDLALNISQDLHLDLSVGASRRADYGLLMELLEEPRVRVASRVLTAVRWFNAANSESNREAEALVDLSIAFEALLGLPRTDKTDRLVDAIALLLGRTPRLDVWAHQFYDARSHVVHEGNAAEIHFAPRGASGGHEGQRYQSLLSYGRQIFELCLAAVLTGARLAHEAGLEEKFVTNQERFERICQVVADASKPACERMATIAPLADAVARYHHVPETGLQTATMLGAARLMAKTVIECNEDFPPQVECAAQELADAERANDHLPELDALMALHYAFSQWPQHARSANMKILGDVVDAVSSMLFSYYIWLKRSSPDEPVGK